MNDSGHLLAAMPVPRAFFKLAAPAVAAQLINILYNLVDKMFIGRIPEVQHALHVPPVHIREENHAEVARLLAHALDDDGSLVLVQPERVAVGVGHGAL